MAIEMSTEWQPHHDHSNLEEQSRFGCGAQVPQTVLQGFCLGEKADMLETEALRRKSAPGWKNIRGVS